MIHRLKRSTRRLLALVLALPVLIMTLAFLYMLGSNYLEGNPRSYLWSLEWASETLTNTGYGADARWNHPLMNLFVMATQWLGIFIIFLAFPIFVLPFFEERFEARFERSLPDIEGYVLFHRYVPEVEFLIEELRRVGTSLLILEKEESLARGLRDRGYQVVLGDVDTDPTLLDGVERARALVTATDDHMDVSFIMLARERGFAGLICALAQDPLHRGPMMKLGASVVYTPEHVLGAALAARSSVRISPQVEGLQRLGTRVGVAEFRVHDASPLAGQRLGDLRLREGYGVTVIGQWINGRFVPPAGPDTRIEPRVILVAVGAHENLAKVEHLAAPIQRRGPIVVAGHGAVGQKVAQMLRDAGEQTLVIDLHPAEGVDVIGNVLDQATLERARVREASAVVLALSSDSAGVFAAAVVRDYAPEVPLIARVNRAASVPRLYQAGADFALSMGQVSGQILAYHLVGESAVSVDQRLKFSRLQPGTLVGQHPWRAGVRERTGAAVVAVERPSGVFVEFEPEFRVEGSDVVFVCGTLETLERYTREYQASPPPVEGTA